MKTHVLYRRCSIRAKGGIFGQTKIWKDAFLIWSMTLPESCASSGSMKKGLPSVHCQNDE